MLSLMEDICQLYLTLQATQIKLEKMITSIISYGM